MKKVFLVLLMGYATICSAQISKSKVDLHVNVGQYPASILKPTFSALHPGINIGGSYTYNSNKKRELKQSLDVGYFYHDNLHHNFMLYTEIGYNFKFKNGLEITPLSIGGGYVLAVLDMQSFTWNSSTKKYEEKNFDAKSNWMAILGSTISYEFKNLLIANRPLSVYIDYRIQLQGIIVKNTVPVLVYTPLKLGVSIPLSANNQ